MRFLKKDSSFRMASMECLSIKTSKSTDRYGLGLSIFAFMEFFVVALAAGLASLLTFFSGFGLGTILTPVFWVFFPGETAITLTAVVHLLNNVFKLGLIGKNTVWKVVLKFGIPGVIGAFLGALLLGQLSTESVLFSYQVGSSALEVTTLNAVLAILIILFAVYDLIPRLAQLEFGSAWLIPGGLISGFFGGLSGHQGALRTAFLVRYGLSKEAFVACGVSIACFIDVARLSVYARNANIGSIATEWPILLTATGAAFVGAYIGRQLLKKVTLDWLHRLVAIFLILLAIAMGSGILVSH